MKFAIARSWGWLSRPRYGIVHLLLFAAVVAAITRWQWSAYRAQVDAAVMRSDVPAARAADEAPDRLNDASVYRGRYDFTADWFTWNVPVWREVLALYRGRPGVRYLEIGAYEGRSAVWMLENVLTDPTSNLTAIDIFDGPYEAKYRANVAKTGAADRVTTIKGPSQIEARKLPLESFDIVYVDGSHDKPDVLEDAVLCWRLLKPGGLLIFDDDRWGGWVNPGNASDAPTDFPKAAIDAFYQCFVARLEVVHNGYQLILRRRPATVAIGFSVFDFGIGSVSGAFDPKSKI